MQLIHLLIAIVAVWRLTEVVTQDRITARLRQSGAAFWSCPRCVSVWAGLFAVAAFAYWPWANWPFALSWLYGFQSIAIPALFKTGRRIVIELDPMANINLRQNDFSNADLAAILTKVLAAMNTDGRPAAVAEKHMMMKGTP